MTRPWFPRPAAAATIALGLLLAACGGGGSAPDPLAQAPAYASAETASPAGAADVTPEQLRALTADTDRVTWLQKSTLDAAIAAEQAAAAADAALVAASTEPEIVARRSAAFAAAAPGLTLLPDGSRRITLETPDGPQPVVLDGEATRQRALAENIRALGSRENAIGLYTLYYGRLPEGAIGDLPAPETLGSLGDAQLQELVDRAAQQVIASLPNESALPPAVGASASAGGRMQAQSLKSRLSNSTISGCGHDDVRSGFVDFDFTLKNDVTPVKSQGTRGTCTTFAIQGGVEAQIKGSYGRTVDLSEQQLYARAKSDWFPRPLDFGDGLWVGAALGKMVSTAMALRTEAAWSYNLAPNRIETELQQPPGAGYYTNSCDGFTEACSDTNHQYGQACTMVNGQKVCARIDPTASGAMSNEHYLLGGRSSLWRQTILQTLQAMQAAVAAGTPVAISMAVESCLQLSSRWRQDQSGNWDSYSDPFWLNRARCKNDTVLGKHSLLVVGYLTDAQVQAAYEGKPGGFYQGDGSVPAADGGGYFIIKNSWGCNSGDGGFVYVSRNVLARTLYEAYTLGAVGGAYATLSLTHSTTQPLPPNAPNTGEIIVQPVTATLKANGNSLVKKVEFYEKTGASSAVKLATKTGSGPWTHAFALGFADNGSHNYFAYGYDADGNVVTTNVTQIRVQIPGAPTVSLSAKPSTVDEGGTVQLGATAASSDGSAIVRVEWLMDGVKIGEDTAAPWSRSVSFDRGEVGDISFRARAVNASGFSTQSPPVVVRVVAKNRPLIGAFGATPALLPGAGTSTLQWSVTGAESLRLNPGNLDVTGSTSRNVSLSATTIYTLTAVNAAGSVQASTTVQVVPPPTIKSFIATPSTTAVGGGMVTLAWSTTDAAGLSIDAGVGNVGGLSSVAVKVTTTTTFTLTATNPGGTATKQVTVTVPNTPPTVPAITAFAATPATLAAPGGTSALSWTVSGATALAIDNGVGSVTGLTNKAVDVTQTTTYTLTATNAAGSSSAQVTVSVTAAPPAKPVITGFTAAPASLPAGGGSSTLAWSVTGATALAIDNGVGDVSGLGSKTVAVGQTTTYTLTASNAGGSTTAQLTVTVAGNGGDRWVDPVNGNDTAAGTAAAPYKTLRKAFGAVTAGSTVWAGDGSYHYFYEGLAANERLGVPAGVTLRGVTIGGAVLQFGLLANASATIADLAFDLSDSLGSAVVATAGNVALQRLKFSHAGKCDAGAVRAAGTAQVTLDPGSTPTHEYAATDVRGFARVVDSAVLTINGGRISGAGRDACVGGAVLSTGNSAQLVLNGVTIANSDFLAASGEYKAVVAAFGSSRVTLANALIDGAVSPDDSANAGVRTVEGAAATIQGSTIRNMPGIAGLAVWAAGTGAVLISDSTLAANAWGVTGGGQAITLRSVQITDNRFGGIEMQYGGSLTVTGSTIRGNWPTFVSNPTNPRASAIGLLGGGDFSFSMRNSTVGGNGNSGASSPAIVLVGTAASSFDLGSDAGGANANVIGGNANLNLALTGPGGLTVRASGATWTAGVQGADGNGHYQPGSAPCGAGGPCVVTEGGGPNYTVSSGAALQLID